MSEEAAEKKKTKTSEREPRESEPARASKGSPRKDSKAAREEDATKANVRTLVGAVMLAILIRTMLFEAFEIEGPSMEPTLQNGDRVVVAKMLYGLYLPRMDEAVLTWGGPRVGDVVIVKSPADGIDIVKRVVAVAGDRIAVRNSVLFRNGERVPQAEGESCLQNLQKEPSPRCRVYEERLERHDGEEVSYEISQDELMCPRHPSCEHEEVVVPEGHVFVRGDHRDHSHDSMDDDIGFVPISRIKGRALFIYYSYDSHHFRGLDADGFRWDRFFESVR